MATAADRDRVIGLLAGHLLACPRFRCPGVDGSTVGDVVAAEYPAAAAAGWVPGQDDLAVRHPELAGAVAAFFRAAPAGRTAGRNA